MTATAQAQAAWFSQATDWSSIVSAAVAVLAVVVGLWVSGTFYQTLALLNRRRKFIGPVVRKAGLRKSRRHFTSTCWRLLSNRARSERAQVNDELMWLSALNPSLVREPGLSATFPVPVPFTFALPPESYPATLTALAAAYTAYASSIRRRWLLRSTAGPLARSEHECAQATAELLRRWASYEPIPDDVTTSRLRNAEVTLAPHGRPASVRLVAWPNMNAPRVTLGFPAVGVSYQPYRVVMADGPAGHVQADGMQLRRVARPPQSKAANPLAFDGVLPRWHGPGYRLEVDRITGRQKLHLCLSETTYFAFRATQEPSAAALAGEAERCSRLLSLNLLAVDESNTVVLVQRSEHVVYPGQYSGTVTGNCELTPREGLQADLDHDGLPDLLGAIAREAREELGLDLTGERSQLAALGLIEYTGATELETHALVATARLPGRAQDFRLDRSAPDPAEGLWELGHRAMTVDLNAVLTDRARGRHFVRWLRAGAELAPQAAGSLLLLTVAQLESRERQATGAVPARAARRPNQWTMSDLEEWLREPLPDGPVKPGRYVRFRPLWK
jgi:8-oxo-dGTP pyrophosphatase MutT (NUDIX family)